MAILLENIFDTDEYFEMWNFLANENYESIVKSNYAPNRLEKWYGYSTNLGSLGNNDILSKEDNIPKVFNRIKNEYYSNADSILLCCGDKPRSDTTIGKHRDHGNFEGKAIMINFGRSLFIEYPYDSDEIEYELQDGDVIEINTKLIHESIQTSKLRLNATLRKVKKQYLPKFDKPLF
jgi:hypothetical protein